MGAACTASTARASKCNAAAVDLRVSAMMRHTVFLLSLVLAAWSAPAAFGGEQDDQVDAWLQQEYPVFLDALLPIEGERRLDVNTTTARIAIRVVPSGLDPSEHEVLFVIERLADGDRRLSLAHPVADSIYQQMRQLKTRNPGWSRELLISAVRLERISQRIGGPSKLSPCIRGLLDVKIDLVADLPMFVDATSYSVRSTTAVADVQLDLMGPGSKSPKQPMKVLKLIESLRAAAEKEFGRGK